MKKCKGFIFLIGIIIVATVTAACGSIIGGLTGSISIKNQGHLYTVVYADSLGTKAVSACETLGEYLYEDMAVYSDSELETAGKYEILVGETNRSQSGELSAGLGMFDYRIKTTGGKLVIVGGSDDAIINAIAYIVHNNVFMSDGVIPGNYDYSFDGADNRDEYIANPDRFLCNWALKFNVPKWMMDYEEKMAAFYDTDGRMMSSVHRGDMVNYPENSLEGVISCIKMGVDNIEIDLRKTKDGVIILMHDDTLNKATDWSEKSGKNGLPTSNKVSDWTLEQIRELRLLHNGKKTDYLVATLEEVFMVCADRTTLRLDKYGTWTWDKDIYPLVKKTGAWTTCLLHQSFGLIKSQQISDSIKQISGVVPPMFTSFKHEDMEFWESKLAGLAGGYLYVIHYAQFEIEQAKRYIDEAKEYIDKIKDDVRFYVDANIMSGGTENAKNFAYLYESGIDFILVDNALALQQYIAENFQPTEH